MGRTLHVDSLETPIGALLIVADEAGRLRAAEFADQEQRLRHSLRQQFGVGGCVLEPVRDPAGLASGIAAYFAGDLGAIDILPAADFGTAFQRAVWRALRGIPAGTTMSYGALAAAIGRPAAVRAVGAANGANPLSVVVPCHRLVGADGSLTGYGGGLARKRWLIDHEAKGAAAR